MLTPREFDKSLRWVLPSGNLGDALLLSAVLKAGHEARGEKFGLVRVPPHTSFFMGHPAVAQIAALRNPSHPVLRTDYWNAQLPASVGSSPYARLSHMLFGAVVGEDRPWAEIGAEDRAPLAGLPFTRAPLLLAPEAEEKPDRWAADRWAELASRLAAVTKAPIVVAGRMKTRVQGVVSVASLLPPRQLVALVERSQAVIGVDPFLAQAARMVGTRSLSLYDVAGIPADVRGNKGASDGAPRLASLSVEDVFARVRDTILPNVDGERPLLG